jgi:hypothetical protein
VYSAAARGIAAFLLMAGESAQLVAHRTLRLQSLDESADVLDDPLGTLTS